MLSVVWTFWVPWPKREEVPSKGKKEGTVSKKIQNLMQQMWPRSKASTLIAWFFYCPMNIWCRHKQWDIKRGGEHRERASGKNKIPSHNSRTEPFVKTLCNIDLARSYWLPPMITNDAAITECCVTGTKVGRRLVSPQLFAYLFVFFKANKVF